MSAFFIEYSVEALMSIVAVALIAAYRILAAKVFRLYSEQTAIKHGSLALLRSDIIRNYDHYCTKGWIPLYGVENVLELHAAYSALGGNGAVTKLIEELKDLPCQDYRCEKARE